MPSVSCEIPSNMVGKVIGKQGSTLKSLERDFSVKIRITEGTAKISGNDEEDCRDAASRIQEIVQKQSTSIKHRFPPTMVSGAISAAKEIHNKYSTVKIYVDQNTCEATITCNDEALRKRAAKEMISIAGSIREFCEASADVPDTFSNANNSCFLLKSNEAKILGIKRKWEASGGDPSLIINSWQICNPSLNTEFKETEKLPGDMITGWHGSGMCSF